MSYLIDSHSHLDFEDFDKDRDSVIQRAFDSGLKAIITIGTNLESSKKSIALAEKYENIFATVSLHPIDVDKEEFIGLTFLDLAHHPKVVAIGETGLDYYHSSDKEKQKQVFQKLVQIAIEVEKPIIIHSRDADEDILFLLKEMALPKSRGVIHCFGRDYEMAKKFLDLGFLISYTGNITYGSERQKSITEVPLEKIIVETDCPFLAPVPFRGQRNEPSCVKYVAEKIAEIKKIDFSAVAEQTTKNCIKLFNLPII
ncbi:MAG TPA: TatD family hydrolase [Candidatus Paceibacterota bacterium]|nr:TatD family hydrolase [Candidatus Paceibacterota bacterium]HRY76879.1 TatD family hydrolase [Candidatus Paceibacterota bacterium]